MRPLPTPCRRRAFDTDDDLGLGLVIGPTLLEASVQDDGNTALLEASVLLDLLTEYFAEPSQVLAQGPATDAESCSKPSISLVDVIPLSEHQVQAERLKALLPPPATHQQADWLDNDWHSLIHWPLLESRFRQQLQAIPLWHHCDPAGNQVQEVLIFTDGSATSSARDIVPCSWAFTVWFQTTAGLCFYGASGQAAPAGTPYHVGELDDSALTGELLALVWGLVWVAEYGPRCQARITFYFDAEAAGRCVFGEWRQLAYQVQPGASSLVQVAIALRQYVSAMCPVHYSHVKGHSGALGNEATDAAAKTARRTADDVWNRCQPTWPGQLALHSMMAWIWTLAAPVADVPTLFAFASEAHRLRETPTLPTQPPTLGIRTLHRPQSQITFDFSCVTFNVLTLREGKPRKPPCHAGMRVLGRKALLSRELGPHKPLLVGLQETRLPDTCVPPDADYYILQSAATDKGVGGCSLWLAKHIPYGTTGSTKYTFKNSTSSLPAAPFVTSTR